EASSASRSGLPSSHSLRGRLSYEPARYRFQPDKGKMGRPPQDHLTSIDAFRPRRTSQDRVFEHRRQVAFYDPAAGRRHRTTVVGSEQHEIHRGKAERAWWNPLQGVWA